MIKITLDQPLSRLGLSMRKFSTLSGIRPNTVTELNNGNAKMVSFETIDRILNGLNDVARERDLNINFTLSDIIHYEYNAD